MVGPIRMASQFSTVRGFFLRGGEAGVTPPKDRPPTSSTASPPLAFSAADLEAGRATDEDKEEDKEEEEEDDDDDDAQVDKEAPVE